MKIVLDTNVLVSALVNPSGTPAAVLNLILSGSVTLLIDNRILIEYSEVLRRGKFGFEPEWITPVLDFIRHESDFISALPVSDTFTDNDDKAFYEVAITGKAENLVTGNLKHFPESEKVVTPAMFIERYQESLSEEYSIEE